LAALLALGAHAAATIGAPSGAKQLVSTTSVGSTAQSIVGSHPAGTNAQAISSSQSAPPSGVAKIKQNLQRTNGHALVPASCGAQYAPPGVVTPACAAQ